MNETAPALLEKVETLAAILGANNWRLATAESCTGGLIGAALTAVPGSSAWYRGGVVAYSNDVKNGVLQVPQTLLDEHGAVSAETVRAMARGVCNLLDVEAGLAVSGIAGPGGGSEDKPVGTVWISARVDDVSVEEICHFTGQRADIRELSVIMALDMLTTLAARLAADKGD